MKSTTPSPSPLSPRTRTVRRLVLFTSIGILIAGGFLIVLLMIDRQPLDPRPVPEDGVIEILSPSFPSPVAGNTENGDPDSGDASQRGGWIQISNEDGNLSQQYRCTHLDPAPEGMGPGWIRMEDPELELYPRGGGRVALTGRSATAYTPRSAVESGRISGDVRIQFFNDGDEQSPSIDIHAGTAEFESILGEIRCVGALQIQTPRALFRGEDLTILLNEGGDILNHLVVSRVIDIRISGGAVATAESEAGGDRSDADIPTLTDRSGDVSPGLDANTGDPPGVVQPLPAGQYTVTLEDAVVIQQGEGPDARWLRGEHLTITFSDPLSTRMADTRTAMSDRLPTPVPLPIMALQTLLATTGHAGDLPPRNVPPGEDILITCAGSLRLFPNPPARQLDLERGEARLELTGSPVRVEDAGSGLDVQCARLSHRTTTGRTVLEGSPENPLAIQDPDFSFTADVFWLEDASGIGEARGPGEAVFHAAGEPVTTMTWQEGVALVFSTDEADKATLGTLRSARCTGGVKLTRQDSAGRGGTRGLLEAGSMDLDFREGGDGRQFLSHVHALGAVVVSDSNRVLWTEELDASFAPLPDDRQTPADEETFLGGLERLHAGGGVEILFEDGPRILAGMVDIDGTARRAVFSGESVTLVDGEFLMDQFTTAIVDETASVYRIPGPGRFQRLAAPLPGEPETRIDRAHLQAAAGTASEMQALWSRDLVLEDIDEESTLLRLRGTVSIDTPDLAITGMDSMNLTLVRESDDSLHPRMLEATGRVTLRSPGASQSLACNHLQVALAPDADGTASPTHLDARGAVEVHRDGQHLWADEAEASFSEDMDDPGHIIMGRVVATGNARIRLEGGERIFASIAESSPDTGIINLRGTPVLVVTDSFVLDQCLTLALDERNNAMTMPGPGRFSTFREPLALADEEGPISIDGIHQLLETRTTALAASWIDGAEYTAGADNEGLLEVLGKVHVESRPDPREFNTVDADALLLRFDEIEESDATVPGARLVEMIARGDVQLESRSWRGDDQSVKPDVFSISGEHVIYDPRTLEGQVFGAGHLLIRDLGEPTAEDSPVPAAADNAFAADGTTLFRWTDSLVLHQVVDTRFRLRMTGDVECLHQTIDGFSSTLTGQELSAAVERGNVTASPDAGSALRLGGEMDIQRIYGEGGLFMRNAQRDVTCDVFDYNVHTGLARVFAHPGRTVTILDKASGGTTTAGEILWDLRQDTIRISRGGGGG